MTDPIRLDGSRWHDLPTWFRLLGYQRGVEVGVGRGWYGAQLCRCVPGVQIRGVDPWIAYPMIADQAMQNQMRAEACTRLAAWPSYQIDPRPSLDAAADVADGSLDFVFIDGDHAYPAVSADIAAWEPKVCLGGIVAGHDYGPLFPGVTRAVDEYADAHAIAPWCLLQAIPDADLDKDVQTWFWRVTA